MKVYLMINSLRGGGAERVCTTIANSLAKQGHEVNLVVLNLNNAVYDKNLTEEVRVINLRKNHARAALFTIASFLRRERPQTILVFNQQLAVLLVVLRKLLLMNFNIIARNINTLSKQREQQTSLWHKHVVHALVKMFYNRVDFIIAQSTGMKEDLMQHYGFEADKIQVIYNPVSQIIENAAQQFSAQSIQQSIHHDTGTEILFVGRLSPQKGVHHLLETFSRCLSKAEDLTLRIVGDGPLRKELESLTSRLNVQQNAIFHGFTDDIVSCYSRADVTVLTSLYEGFPNVLVESITMGTPVVAFDCRSGPKEIIVEGVNGFLVPQGDTEYLENKILEAIEKEWNVAEMTRTAERYASENIIQEYIKILERYSIITVSERR